MSKRRLILIHGIGQGGKSPNSLKADWLSAIAVGLGATALPQCTTVSFPFYADRLRDAKTKSGVGPQDSLACGLGEDSIDSSARERFFAKLYSEIAQGCGFSVRGETGGPEGLGPQNWGLVVKLAQWLSEHNLGASLVRVFAEEAWSYLRKPAIRRAVNRIVANAMLEGDYDSSDSIVIVGHSLGSVVAFNLLNGEDGYIPNNLRVECLLTIGSPLAISAIKDALELPIQNPGSVSKWINARDKRDIVALHPLTKCYFHQEPADFITNIDTVENVSDNRHGALEYLASTQVGQALSSHS